MRLLAAILACSMSAGPAFAAVSPYGAEAAAAPEDDSASVQFLDEETEKLRDAVANPNISNTEVYLRARSLFDAIPNKNSSNIGTVSLRGWEKPDLRTKEDVGGMVGRVQEVLVRNWSEYEEPPAPELVDAYFSADSLQKNDKIGYDKKDFLKKNQLGAFIYTAAEAVGVLFNKTFRILQRFLGDGLASATAVHEATHAKDHATGELNPVEVKKGEIAAFKAEYLWLLAMDRRGEKLAWARVTYCRPDSKAPELVCKYLEHLAKIKYYGERDDFKGLVDELGYQDRSENPFHFHPEPGEARAGKDPDAGLPEESAPRG